ncbi:hypothetical protein MA16_Dca028037 [Dendrobium catenatum]|uniref:Uncharacterized protein n=1 Tax=Dendrobium catenatum TaxID=906689 RepID=A0A2I0VE01_9ASPA|nr:hypothetical protein MA16_Dca028037 [Dendrobium catenatum]
MFTFLLGRNLVLKLLNSGRIYVWMLVRLKKSSILKYLCTLILLFTGITGLRISAWKR